MPGKTKKHVSAKMPSKTVQQHYKQNYLKQPPTSDHINTLDESDTDDQVNIIPADPVVDVPADKLIILTPLIFLIRLPDLLESIFVCHDKLACFSKSASHEMNVEVLIHTDMLSVD